MYWLKEEAFLQILKKVEESLQKEVLSDIFLQFQRMPLAFVYREKVYIIGLDYVPETFFKEDFYVCKNVDERFLSASVVLLDSYYVGIVEIEKLQNSMDYETFYGKVVQTMFHAYQLSRNEKRFTDELILLKYPFTKKILSLFLLERHYLLKALVSKYGRNKECFMKARMMRKELLGDYFEYDAAIESFEGVSEYVSQKARMNLQREQSGYIVALMGGELADRSFDKNLYRRSLTINGLFMALLLDRIYPEWQIHYQNSDDYLYTFLEKSYHYQSVMLEENKFDDLAEYLLCQEEGKRQERELLFEREAKQILSLSGEMWIESMDPESFCVLKDSIIHEKFLGIHFLGKSIRLEGPIKVFHGENMFQIEKMSIPLKELLKMKTNQVEVKGLGKLTGNIFRKGKEVIVSLK